MRLGRYELLYRLAKGGMGEVFVARRKGPGDIEKRVVIKRIRKHLSGDPRFVEMFLREAKVSMTLSHRNIAAVFDFGRAGSELFIAMEHIDGRDLAKALKAARVKEKALSASAVAFVGIEVCRALDYAHSSGSGDEPLVHRDLSPKNLLLSFSGEVVVADFGLAIESQEQNELGRIRGTPAYMSPEQAKGKNLDGRADLFALGLILREMLTDEAAYCGQTSEEILAKAVAGEIATIGDDQSAELVSIIEKATSHTPEDRYSTAQEMLEALDSFLIGERSKGAPQPRRELRAWLRGLFDADKDANVPTTPLVGEIGANQQLDVVTYLDDGDEAINRRLRSHSGATLASLAATVADTNASIGGKEDDTHSDSSAHGTNKARRHWIRWPVLLIAIAGLGITAALLRSSSTERAIVDETDASHLSTLVIDAPFRAPIDASVAKDALPTLDATRQQIDARPAAKTTFGWVRVHSQPWARVAIRGTSGCPETPCRIRLPAGNHRVSLVNPVTKAKANRTVTIRDSETTDLTVALQKPSEAVSPEPNP